MGALSGLLSTITGVKDPRVESSEKAADAQVAAANAAAATQWRMYEDQAKRMKPWEEAGKGALTKLQQKISAGPGKFVSDYGYQFRLAEGQKGIGRAASASGRLASGSTMKEMSRFNQNYASNEYDKFLARYYQSLAPLQSLSGVGQTTGAQLGTLGQQTGTGIAQTQLAAGNARATNYMNQGNLWGNQIANTIGGGMWGYGQYQQAQQPIYGGSSNYSYFNNQSGQPTSYYNYYDGANAGM